MLRNLMMRLLAPPAGSTMVNPTVVQGRWLLPSDENALVVSASAVELSVTVGFWMS